MSESDDKLAKVLKRVRQLIAKAEANIAPGATDKERAATLLEQMAAREMADSLMLQYQIDRITAEEGMSEEQRSRAGTKMVELGGYTDIFWDTFSVAQSIARHTRCRLNDTYTYDKNENTYMVKVYGFQADLEYFEIMFTTVRLHMLGVLLPKWDESASLEDNCYRLHEAGYNWLQIAAMQGWFKLRADLALDVKVPYKNKYTDEVAPATRVGGIYKRAYLRACEKAGHGPTVIPPKATETFRKSAAEGYGSRLEQRLRAVRDGRPQGTGLVLANWTDDIDRLYKEDHPERVAVTSDREPYEQQECPKCKAAKSGYCRQHRPYVYKPQPFSSAGYAAGARHAETVSLSTEASASRTEAIR